MGEDAFMDFGTLNREVEESLVKENPDLTSALPTKDELMEDLLSEIDEQEVKAADIDQVRNRGITNDDQADFFIRRYKALEDTCCNINDAADQKLSDYQEKVESWRENQLKSYQYTMDYIRGMLEAYAHSRLEGSKKRSLKLIEGSIGFVKQQPAYEHDDDKLREYLGSVSNGDKYLQQVPPKVKWGELKKIGTLDNDGVFRINGTAVPGVVVTKRQDKFAVK